MRLQPAAPSTLMCAGVDVNIETLDAYHESNGRQTDEPEVMRPADDDYEMKFRVVRKRWLALSIAPAVLASARFTTDGKGF